MSTQISNRLYGDARLRVPARLIAYFVTITILYAVGIFIVVTAFGGGATSVAGLFNYIQIGALGSWLPAVGIVGYDELTP